MTTDTVAVVVGCGDLAVQRARLIGRRHPLFMIDVSRERLSAEGHDCDITDPASVGKLAGETAHDPRRLRFVDQTPLKREGSVAEAVALIDFLLQPAASFVNGVDLLVDGGGRAAARVAACGW